MPKDSKGNYHPNIQRAHAADRMDAKPKESPAVAANMMGNSGEEHTTMHANGDGTYRTEGSGQEPMEHPSIGHALMNMASKHSDGDHMHVHQGMDGEVTTHHVMDGGSVEGPHSHEHMDAAAEHMKSTMGGGMHDPGMTSGADWPKAPSKTEGADLHGM